jgi:hypothetical protein
LKSGHDRDNAGALVEASEGHDRDLDEGGKDSADDEAEHNGSVECFSNLVYEIVINLHKGLDNHVSEQSEYNDGGNEHKSHSRSVGVEVLGKITDGSSTEDLHLEDAVEVH